MSPVIAWVKPPTVCVIASAPPSTPIYIGVLRQTCGRRRRRRHDQVGIVTALVDHGPVSQAATGAGHVGDLHGFVDRADIEQNFADLTAGKVPATAGVRRRDTFRSRGRACGHSGCRHCDNGTRHERLQKRFCHWFLPFDRRGSCRASENKTLATEFLSVTRKMIRLFKTLTA